MYKFTKVLIGVFIFCLIFTYDVYAQETLTLQQATLLAVQHSKALQQTTYDIERNWEIRDDAAAKIPYIPIGATSGDTALAAAYAGLISADLNIQMSNKNKSIEIDAIKLNVMDKYLDVLMAQASYDYVKESLNVSNKDWDISKTSYKAGIISNKQLTLADIGNQSSMKNLEAAQITLDKAYQELNTLIGYDAISRYKLLDEPVFVSMKIDDVDSTITRIMDGNPSIWLAEQHADLAKLQLSLPSAEPYKVRAIAVDKAELSVVQSRENMRNALYSSYQSIKQLEHNYELSEQALKIAEVEYENNKLLYDAGMLSKVAINKSQLAVLKARMDIKRLICQHEVLKEAFFKPWAYR